VPNPVDRQAVPEVLGATLDEPHEGRDPGAYSVGSTVSAERLKVAVLQRYERARDRMT
jgi:hypothetical protein